VLNAGRAKAPVRLPSEPCVVREVTTFATLVPPPLGLPAQV
jgi:hypothetical protein